MSEDNSGVSVSDSAAAGKEIVIETDGSAGDTVSVAASSSLDSRGGTAGQQEGKLSPQVQEGG
jgi:hypothetical protein